MKVLSAFVLEKIMKRLCEKTNQAVIEKHTLHRLGIHFLIALYSFKRKQMEVSPCHLDQLSGSKLDRKQQ